MEKQFEHRAGMMRLRDDGILQVGIKEGIEFTSTDASEMLQQKIAWTTKRVPLLVDYRTSHSTHFDVFVEGFEHVVRELSAAAYVVESSVGQRVAEDEKRYLFEGLPGKVFFSLTEAEAWLKTFVTED